MICVDPPASLVATFSTSDWPDSGEVVDLIDIRMRACRDPNPNKPLVPSSNTSISTSFTVNPNSLTPLATASSVEGAMTSNVVLLSSMDASVNNRLSSINGLPYFELAGLPEGNRFRQSSFPITAYCPMVIRLLVMKYKARPEANE